ncbi:MAG: carboxypeptidase-like regulatory domain-containing protein, partial [Duncaniella sp.]|nr:carboxypeptidase-like regulatory domain-containing protein [Duncaniella sp.]
MLLVVLALVTLSVSAQTRNISGTVTDEGGDPMPGVSVIIKGTNQGTSTDIDGKYSVKAANGATLEFSYIGYTTQKVTVGSQTVINISMQEDIKA